MNIFNFKTPATFFASLIWNISEDLKKPLPKRLTPIIFGLAMGMKGQRLMKCIILEKCEHGEIEEIKLIPWKEAKKLVKKGVLKNTVEVQK